MARNRNDYIQTWIKENYEKLYIWVEKGEKERIKQAAQRRHMSMRQFVIQAIKKEIEKKP